LGVAHRAILRDRVVAEMTNALRSPGDAYRAPDGVAYALEDEPIGDLAPCGDTLAEVNERAIGLVIEEVLRFESLPLGCSASRRAMVRWSDGTESEAIRWYSDEVLICEGDLLGKTQDELRSLHFRRDRDWLRS
jgi:hypothetical protein